MAVAFNEEPEKDIITEDVPKTHPLPPIRNWTFTIFLTPVVAWALALFGYIPFEPMLAALNGFLFSLVYVGYRVYYWKRSKREYDKWKREEQDVS